MDKFYFLKREGIEYFTPKETLKNGSALIVFTTRNKGVSKECYKSLNLAFHVGDNEGDVIKNRLKLIKTFGFKKNSLTCAEQVHGNKHTFVSEKEAGSGEFNYSQSLKNTDSLITNLKNVPLTLFFADCVPIVFVDKKKSLAGIIHAGWKGTYQEISKKTIAELVKKHKSISSEISVFIGPSIGPCCYEVDDDLRNRFERKFKGTGIENRKNLNLVEINKYQLKNAGILEENISSMDICTCCNSDLFFSHRRSRKTGRQVAIVALL